MMMSGPGRGRHPPPVPGRPADEEVVSFANWPGYIDTDPADPARHPTLAEFTRRTAIAVNYIEPIGSDDQFFARIGVPLAMGASTGFDLVVLSDWMVAQLIGLGWAEEIRRAAESGQIRSVTNSYRGGLDRGDIAACGLVRRRDGGREEQSAGPVRPARGRGDAVDRQHADPRPCAAPPAR
jgi:hypothetical protein